VPLPPGSTIGILGGGQLGRMIALAAARLGFKTHVYADEWGCACDVTSHATVGSYDDLARINAFAAEVAVVTYEFENVPLAAAAAAEAVAPVRPGPRALAVSQDRLEEKSFITKLGIDVAPYAAIDGPADFAAAVAVTGAPAILKTRRFGYDGKGQLPLQAASDLDAVFADIGGVPCVLERRVPFAFEVSVLVVRGVSGETSFYDIPVNEHGGGILRRSSVPAALDPAARAKAHAIASRIADELGYVGVLAVEMFATGDPAHPFLVNELAPRVHNSGHWTMDAAVTCQFENHVRAIAGWPLGSTRRHCDVVMENLIGPEVERWRTVAADADTVVHIYDKGEARPGRKMGHLNRLSVK
jgi:5-(carboxyamino)imidazole ribonucleotide synthase